MLKKTLTAGISALALAVAMTGCTKAEGPVLARVNRTTITTEEFKKQLEDLAPQMQHAVMTDPKARKEFLEDLIGIELVLQEARQQGLDRDADYRKRQEALKKEMERRIQEEAKNDLFNAVLKKEIGDKLNKVAAPSDQDMREYFDKNKEKIIAAAGRKVTLREIGPQLKMRIMQEKRRDLYLEYAKGLRDKAKITVDDKALDQLAASLAQPKEIDLSHMQVETSPKKDDTKK